MGLYSFIKCTICSDRTAIQICHNCNDSQKLQCQICFDKSHDVDGGFNHIKEKLSLSDMKRQQQSKLDQKNLLATTAKSDRLNDELLDYQKLKSKIEIEMDVYESTISTCKNSLLVKREELYKLTKEVDLLKHVNENLEKEKKEIESQFDAKVKPIRVRIEKLEEDIIKGKNAFKQKLEDLEGEFKGKYDEEEELSKKKIMDWKTQFTDDHYEEEENLKRINNSIFAYEEKLAALSDKHRLQVTDLANELKMNNGAINKQTELDCRLSMDCNTMLDRIKNLEVECTMQQDRNVGLKAEFYTADKILQGDLDMKIKNNERVYGKLDNSSMSYRKLDRSRTSYGVLDRSRTSTNLSTRK